jgi:hypothetical protein
MTRGEQSESIEEVPCNNAMVVEVDGDGDADNFLRLNKVMNPSPPPPNPPFPLLPPLMLLGLASVTEGNAERDDEEDPAEES